MPMQKLSTKELNKLNFTCEKCGRVLKGVNFYNSPVSESGKFRMCKKCATLLVDCWDQSTYLWILQECDVPYVPEVWNKCILDQQKRGNEITGLLIVGKYLSQMYMIQWNKFRWKDTEYIKQQSDRKVRDAMERSGYSEAQIQEMLEKGRIDLPADPNQKLKPPLGNAQQVISDLMQYRVAPPQIYNAESATEFYEVADAPKPDEEIGDTGDTLVDQLTPEDKIYLRLKWGKEYKPDEWIALEKLYNEMMASYDIQSAGHIDTLKLLCKTSLKCNQLIDINDVEGYQKMSRVYDSLMKSGHFTAAQSKETTEGVVDSIGELVAMCERDEFIPRYYVDKPADKVDQVIFDLQQYTKNLITDELGMGNLLENALKKLYEEHDLLNKTATEGETTSEEDLLMKYDGQNFNMIDEDDFLNFQETEDEWATADADIQEKGESPIK